MTARYGAHIYWLETSPHVPRPPLAGSRDADVVIVGGGYTGLWTAYHLRQADPSVEVVVLEREEIGFGASGRNGGFAMTLLDMSLAHLRRNHGDDAARRAPSRRRTRGGAASSGSPRDAGHAPGPVQRPLRGQPAGGRRGRRTPARRRSSQPRPRSTFRLSHKGAGR